jgi:autotransporter-associated beta strand protein
MLEQLEYRRLLATNITQYHVDSQSTGANLTETQLTPSNVNAADFGQLYNTPLDGQVYAEPLVLTNVTIDSGPNTVGTPGTYNSVVFVATQHDSLYAINAADGTILWQRTFLDTTNPNDYLPGATSVTTIPSADTDSTDIDPEVGITSTPVIDPSTNIIYVLPNTKEIVDGNAYYVQRLHAINVADGTDATASFVIGSTTNGNTNNTPISIPGSGDGNVNGVVQFNALRENNRPALSLVNGEVYAEWASHGDNGPYHGWVVRWDVSNLSTQGIVLSGVLCTDPNGGEGGIWGGGGGLTFDPSETFNGEPAFYFETGNGDPRGGPPPLDGNGFPSDDNYYESLVKVEEDPTTTAANPNSNGWGMKIVDYFTPYNVNALDDADEDFGSGSPLVLPDSAGIPGHPHLIIAAGKEGTIYLLDRDNLGKFNVNDDDVLNSVYDPATGITTPPVLINGSLSTPAYYDGTIYWVAGYNSNAWSYVVAPNPAPDPPTVPIATLEPTSETANNNFGYVPGSVMISADGSEDPAGGIAWIMDTNNGEIHAYSTLSLSTELWNSGPASIATVKFAVPTIANGQVFVGTQNSLQVFGVTGPSTPAQAPNAPANLTAQALSGSSVELNWTDNTVSPNFATNYAIELSTNGINFTTVANAGQESTSFTVIGLAPSTTYEFEIISSNSSGSSGPSNIASATTTTQTGQTPTAPEGLGATPASGSEVYLTWTNTAADETGFVLTRATDSLFTQNVVTETLASAPYYYTDATAGLSPGNVYYYKLEASNSAGFSSTSNTASVTIPNVPAAPTDATAVLNNGQVVVSWTDHAGPFALGYQISRSVDGGPYTIYTDRPETSDSPPTTQTFTDSNIPLGHTYTYEIVAENVAGFSNPAYASVGVLGSATVSLDQEGNLVLTAAPGVPDRLSVQLTAGNYILTDLAVNFAATGAEAASVSGAGSSAVTIPAANVSAMVLDTADGDDSIRIISDAVPITITADSGGGQPVIDLGDVTNNAVIDGTITNDSNGTLSIDGSGTTTIDGSLVCDGLAGVTLGGSGTINIAGDINLGSAASLVDTGSGPVTISGLIKGTATSGVLVSQGLAGDYFNLPAAQDLIQPADAGNPAWLGNQNPAATAQLIGPIDFPDIADNGFADNLGDPAYYNLGAGNNTEIEARWYGDISIPGTGTTPVPIDFATTSDDGSMLYIDGNAVVNNNNFQGATQATGLVDLTPGLHAIDVEYYQGGGGASMDLQWDTTGGTNFVDIPNSAFSYHQVFNGLTMNGGGTLTLTKTNAFVGPTTIDAGTLIVTANGALGPPTAAGIVVNAGGALALEGGVRYTRTEPITISGSGPAGNGAIESISGANDFASPVTLAGTASIGSDSGSLTLTGNISAASSNLMLIGAGATMIHGNIVCQGGSVDLGESATGAITIAGNVNLGSTGNLIDSGSGSATIAGAMSGTATPGSGNAAGLIGEYFNLPAAQDLIQPADAGNPAWLGNQTPAMTAALIGPIDFPDIADNGFADSLDDPAYYNLGAGNNVNVEARWYGDIMIPGTGTTPVPIDFATTSDDGSMLYIDGNAVVTNNNFQGATQATGIDYLTPGPHSIDVEYYQGGGGATMDVQWDPTGGTNFVDIPNAAFVNYDNALVKIGDGTLTLTNTNTYVGSTTVDAGTLILAANGATGPADAAGITVNSGGALAFADGVNDTDTESITISGSGPAGNGAIENISGANAFIAPITLSGAATIGSDAGALTIGGNIATGSNTLTLIGAGTTTINGNITSQGGDIDLADDGAINIAGNINLGQVGNLSDASSGTDTISGVLSGTATTAIVQGNIEPINSLTMDGDGTLTLTNINTYVGATTISRGTLVVTANGATGPATAAGIFVNSGGALALGGGVTDTSTEPITIAGSGPAGDGAIENLNSANTFAAPIALSGAAAIDTDDGSLTLGGNIATGSSTVTLLGAGTTTINGNIVCAGGSVTLADTGTLEIAGSINLSSVGNLSDDSSGQNTISGVISGTATAVVANENALTKMGTGTLTVTNNDTYIGSTTIDAGEFVVNGTVLGSAITIGPGATLTGDGSVGAVSVQDGGVFAPGNSPGTLTTSSLLLGTGSTFAEQLGGTTAATEYDQTVIPAGGSVALGGAPLNITFLNGFAPTVGQQFTLINNQTGNPVVGTFSQGTMFTLNGNIYGINYAGGAGQDVVLTALGQTTTVLSSSIPSDSSTVGQSVTLTARVTADAPASGNPVGMVVFEDGSTILRTVTLSQGSASFTTSALSAGGHSITADFVGTDGWLNSTNVLMQTVSKAPTTTNIATSPSTPVSGQSLDFIATVSPSVQGVGAPTGSVAFYVDGALVGNAGIEVIDGVSTANFQDSGLPAGSHTIAADYGGDPTFEPGTLVSTTLIVGTATPPGGGSSGGSSTGPTQRAMPPQLTRVALSGVQHGHSTLVLQFSEALDPTPAMNLQNYSILHGRSQRIKVLSAVYNAATWTVTLRTKQRISPHGRYQLTVNGAAPSGLISASGVYLDGRGTGVGGTSAVRSFN